MQTTFSPASARTTGPRITAFRACMALDILSVTAAPQNALASNDTQRLQNTQNFLVRPVGLSASDQTTSTRFRRFTFSPTAESSLQG